MKVMSTAIVKCHNRTHSYRLCGGTERPLLILMTSIPTNSSSKIRECSLWLGLTVISLCEVGFVVPLALVLSDVHAV